MERVVFLKNKEPYESLEFAKQALNAYAQANSLLDGEPIIGRYKDDDTIKLVLGVCTVTETGPSGCVTGEKLTFFIDEESIETLRLENLTDVDVLSKIEGDVIYYDGEKWINKADAVFDEHYVHTDNNYTTSEKTKLANIESGAEVNVQSDWNVTDTSSDAYIKNKPTIGSGVLTIKKNDSDNGTQFSANSTTDVTANFNLATVATSGNYNDLSSVPTNVSHFTNDAGYLVSSDINGKADKVEHAANGDLAGLDTNGNLTDSGIVGTDVAEAVEKMHTHSNKAVLDATTASFTDSNYVHTDNNYTTAEKNKLSGIAENAEVNVQSDWNATDTNSDAYIKNKPAIPTALSDLSDDVNHRLVTDTDIQNWNEKYTKPNGGIPKTDLDTNVQSSLDKADTSVQASDISDMQVKSNLRTTFQTTPDNTHYPSEKLVKDSLDAKEPTLATQTAYTQKGTSTKVPQITTNSKGQVTGIIEVDISFPSGSVTGDTTTFVKSITLSGHTLTGQTQAADSQITDAASGIPTTEAVREFVNSSVSNMAANYITKNANGDAFDSNSELISASTYYSGGAVFTPTKNDYAIVLKDETQAEEIPGYSSFTDDDEYIGFYILVGSTYTLVTDSNVSSLGIVAGITKAYELPTTRYINSSTTATSWSFQYIINDSGLTAAQIAAINSGINATKVGNYETHISDTTIHVTASDKSNWNNKLDPVTAVTHDSTKNYVKQVTQSTNGQVSIVEEVLDYNDLANAPTIPSAPGTLITNATNAQTASSGESMSGTITLHKVSKTGSYNDLLNKPTIPTVPTDVSAFNNDAGYITLGDVPGQVNADWNSNSGVSQILNKPTIPAAPGTLVTNATAGQTASSGEAMSGTITLHKVSKTGSYNDLLNKPTIPSAPGTLNTTATTSQTATASEALSGNITLHKVSKTGSYNDLLNRPSLAAVATSGSYNDLSNKPTIPSAPGTLNTTATTAQSTSSSEALSGNVTLHKIAKTGSYSDLLNKPTIPAAQVNSDWNANSGVAEILNKPTIPNIPSQTGQSGKFLTTNGTDMSWATVSSGGGTWGSITGTLSNQTDLQNALDAKQDEIVQQTSAPSNPSDGDLWIDTDETPVSTINLSDLGDTTISSPTNGQVLSYNSTTSKWENTTAPSGLPSQTGHSGEFLTTNGTLASWTSIPSIPTPQVADENKLLSVNSSGQYVLVTIVNSENVAY